MFCLDSFAIVVVAFKRVWEYQIQFLIVQFNTIEDRGDTREHYAPMR